MFAEVMPKDAYRSYRIRLELLLGIPYDSSDLDVHELIKSGFTPDRIMSLCDLGLMSPFDRDQVIAIKTLRVRAVRNQRLSVHESDQLFRFVHVTAMLPGAFRGRNEG